MSPSPADLDPPDAASGPSVSGALGRDAAGDRARQAVKRARGPGLRTWILGLAALALVGGAGAWVALSDPFERPEDAAAPEPAEGNLLGEAWSFESTATTSPSAAWVVPDEAPTGFVFPESAAVSGRAGASAPALGGEDGEPWARILSAETFRIPPGGELLQVSGTSDSDNLSLMVRFLTDGRPPLDTVLASGAGRLVGHAHPPPGSTAFRVGVNAVGRGAIDDLDVRFVTPADAAPAHGDRPSGDQRPLMGEPRAHGLYTVFVGDPRGLTVFHGQELMLRIEPAALFPAVGPGSGSGIGPAHDPGAGLASVSGEAGGIPGSAGFLPGTGEIAGLGGARAQFRADLLQDGRRLVLAERLTHVPAGTVVVHQALAAGALADAPLGIRSANGFDRFTGDFRVEGVDALLMGPTRNRLVLEMGTPFTLSATHRDDGTIALSIELAQREEGNPGSVSLDVALQAEFKEERVAAAQLRDSAEGHEKAGRLGAALADIEVIVTDYPYDEGVLEAGLAARARIQAIMQERLDALDADLEDALFLGSAVRCREVRQAALSEAVRFAGCEAEAQFRQRAADVEERAARLLEEDVLRRRKRVEALADSYASHGGYPLLADEFQRALDEHLTLVIGDGSDAGDGD